MRQFIRHPSDIPLEYTIGNIVVHEREYLKDVSKGGLCFHSKISLKKGVGIHVKIPICNPVFEVDGVVVWCLKSGKNYDIGVSFGDDKTEFGVRMTEQVCYIEHYKKEMFKKEGRILTGEAAAIEWIEKNASGFPI